MKVFLAAMLVTVFACDLISNFKSQSPGSRNKIVVNQIDSITYTIQNLSDSILYLPVDSELSIVPTCYYRTEFIPEQRVLSRGTYYKVSDRLLSIGPKSSATVNYRAAIFLTDNPTLPGYYNSFSLLTYWRQSKVKNNSNYGGENLLILFYVPPSYQRIEKYGYTPVPEKYSWDILMSQIELLPVK